MVGSHLTFHHTKKDDTPIQDVDEWLQARHALLQLLKTNLCEAKKRMKHKTDAS